MTTFEKTTLGSWSISEKSLNDLYERLEMWKQSLIDILIEYYENKHCTNALYEFELQYEQIKSVRNVDLERIRIINKYLVKTTEEINRLVIQ